MTTIIPVINVTDRHTFGAWDVIPTDDGIMVRLRDLVIPGTLKPNATFHRIVDAGGIHQFLGYSGKITLSLVIKDEVILRFHPQRYAYYINSIKPNFYTTIDAETYKKEYSLSRKEIRRALYETERLIELCPRYKPLGLVKGCTPAQVRMHARMLRALGITTMILHTGDFLRNGKQADINLARSFAQAIRPYATKLFLYGFGSQRKMTSFGFADAYITFGHCVAAINGRKIVGMHQHPYTGGYRKEIIMHNIVQMHKTLQKTQRQTKITQWSEELWAAQVEEQESNMHKHDTAVPTSP